MKRRYLFDSIITWRFAMIAAVLVIVSGAATAFAQANGQPSKPNKYGAREPVVCKDKKAPAKGAINADLAAKYVSCERDKVSGDMLYLVEGVKAQVGVGRPYNPKMDLNVPEMDVRFPIYPIRGSLVSYQCSVENPGVPWMAPGKNCNRYNEPEAKGFCYRTTFGDWRCYMSDSSNKSENFTSGVAPPRP